MFKTFRHYYKNANKRSVTIKEWDNLDKALAYAKRYAKGSRFISCNVTDNENTPLYLVAAEGVCFTYGANKTADVEPVATTEKETAELEQIVAENHIDETPAYHIELVREEKPAAFCGKAVFGPEDIADIFRQVLKNEDRELVTMLALDTKHRVIGINVVSQGTLDASIVHPREVFKAAMLLNASGIIVCHNHPSGNITPSREDSRVSKKLVKAGEILNIPVLDHLIVGWEMDGSFRYYSFKEQNNIF
nr:MAG TPA: protein of unknown function DUF2466 [Caudoviricetes sp.]